ncbi:hypothetical protein [Aquimarina rubra]|uniref:SnoaL-like domain-containing protein n=1 Tax=Aquimarina rubra TaxID=1920033 RepID=A0ABW5LII6_9FLAO
MRIKKSNHVKNTLSFLSLLLVVGYFGNNLAFSNNITQKRMIINQDKKEKLLYVELYGEKGSNVEVRFNDIPISKISITDKGYGNSFAAADHYAIPGINTLSIYPLSKKGITTIRLVKYSKGEITGEDSGETLLKIIIENDDTPIHKQITLSSNRIRWSWMDTDNIDNKKSKEEAIAFSKEFYKIMQQNNIEKMIKTADPIINYELVSKPGTQKEKIVKEWTKGLKMAFTDQDIYDDIDSIDIQLVPIANGKLFEVKRKDGSFLFRTSVENEFPVGFKSIIGRKNGIWQFYH